MVMMMPEEHHTTKEGNQIPVDLPRHFAQLHGWLPSKVLRLAKAKGRRRKKTTYSCGLQDHRKRKRTLMFPKIKCTVQQPIRDLPPPRSPSVWAYIIIIIKYIFLASLPTLVKGVKH